MKNGKIISFILVLTVFTMVCASLITACSTTAPDMSGVSFESKSFVYDGTEHELVISGTLPEGVTVTYENNKLTDVGTVEATAKFTHKNSKVVIEDMKATLTVTPAAGDIGTATFSDKTVIYDGTEQEITIEGTLPEGVSVTYENNKLTNVGSIEAIAHFTHENANIVIPDAKATLTVIPADGSLGTATFTDKTVTYDGSEHELTVEGVLPEGVSVSYSANKLTMPGSVEVTASFTSENPNYTFKDLKATLTVNKITLSQEDVSLVSSVFVYDGNSHSVKLDLPEYVKYTLTNGEATDAGDYVCLAEFDKETVDAPFMSFEWSISKADFDEELLGKITLNDKTFVYDGNEHSLVIEGADALPEGSTVEYSANNKLTKPGSVNVTATVRNKNYNGEIVRTANLTVNKALIDMSGVKFEDAEFEYDGTGKEILATGVPENVLVSYSGNGQINTGSYSVTAEFKVKENEDCYELSVNSATATLKINHKVVKIYTVEELQAINDTVVNSANYKYELANDIDGSKAVDQENLVDGKFRWKGIGSFTNPFRTSFNGNGYTISNLYIDVNSGVFEAGQYFIGIFNVVSTNAADNLWIENFNVANIVLDIDTDGKITTTGTLIGRIGTGNNETIGLNNITISDSTMTIKASRTHAGTAIGWSCGNKGVQIKNVQSKNVDITADVTSRADIGGFVGEVEYKANYYVDCSVDEFCDINVNVQDEKGFLNIGGFAGRFAAQAYDIELFITRCSSAAQINVTTPENFTGTFDAGKILAYSSNAGGDVLGQTYILVNWFDNGQSYTNMEEFGWSGSFKVNSVEKEDLVYYNAAGVAYAESNVH